MTTTHPAPPLGMPGQHHPHSRRTLIALLIAFAVAVAIAVLATVVLPSLGNSQAVGPGSNDGAAAAAPAQSAANQPAVATTSVAPGASPSRSDPPPVQKAEPACKLVTAQEAGQAGGFGPVSGVSDSTVVPKSATAPDGVVRQCRFGSVSAGNVTVGADVFPNAAAALAMYGKWHDLLTRTLANAPADLSMSGAIGPKGEAMLTQDDLTPSAAVFFVEGPVLVRITVATPGANQAPVAGAKNLAVIAASRVPELVKA